MLGIDVAFFLVELISGFLVHSLALMADAFHMLNDIISLLVGLWAVNLAQKATTDKYSYGWLRAEILGAFFNAVFLIALCVSILLEAITRFFDPPEISNPQLILIVGSLGLASNLIGFVVLGGHGHAHGHDHDHDHGDGHEHSHSHNDLAGAEEGRVGANGASDEAENGPILEYLPEVVVAKCSHNKRISFDDNAQGADRTGSGASRRGRSRRRGSSGRNQTPTIDDFSIHPSTFRQDIIYSTRPQPQEPSSESDDDVGTDVSGPSETTPLIVKDGGDGSGPHAVPTATRPRRDSTRLHATHNHERPRKAGGSGHGHNHADMGMNAMVLHVLGDALGNVGVIVTALIIWLTDWPGKYYADPAVSLFITLIILKSALPLTFATAKILLQATPEGLEVKEIREDIERTPGVMSCHHVHIWQLSDTKIVASMHIHVAFPISEAGGAKYMALSKSVRRCLHAWGIHSATIQPEFCLDETHGHVQAAEQQFDLGQATDGTDELRRCRGTAGEEACLLECVDECVGQGCCPPATASSSGGSTHSHSHGHGHDEDGHHH